jgi:actin-related protein
MLVDSGSRCVRAEVIRDVDVMKQLHHAGLMSGIVVDSGAAVTHIVPVMDGIADHHHTRRLQLAGDHVTNRLRHLLAKRGYALPGGMAGGVAAMKERCCYVAVDYARELVVRF